MKNAAAPGKQNAPAATSKRLAKVSSTALARYRMNDYSVPTAYGFRDVQVKGFVNEVVIICGAGEIACHPRI